MRRNQRGVSYPPRIPGTPTLDRVPHRLELSPYPQDPVVHDVSGWDRVEVFPGDRFLVDRDNFRDFPKADGREIRFAPRRVPTVAPQTVSGLSRALAAPGQAAPAEEAVPEGILDIFEAVG